MRALMARHGKHKPYWDIERKFWNMSKSEVIIGLVITTITMSILITQFLETDLLSWSGNLLQMK